MTFYVYTLADPRTGVARYVGCTISPEHRLRGHLRAKSGPVAAWVAELSAVGLVPRFDVGAIAHSPLDAHDLENARIDRLRAEGAPLLNKNRSSYPIVRSKRPFRDHGRAR